MILGGTQIRQIIGASLTSEQADALALEKPRISLTDIRSLGINTTRQAKAVADHLVSQQLLEWLSDTQFQVPERLRQRFEQIDTRKVTGQVGTKLGPSWDQVGTKLRASFILRWNTMRCWPK